MWFHTELLQRVAAYLPAGLLRRFGRTRLGRWLRRRTRGGSSVSRISRGPAAGLLIDSGGVNPGYALGISEPVVQRALQRHLKGRDVFYDVGANVGFFTLLAARLVGSEGHVYAFEPVPATATRLRRNLRLNGFENVEVLEVALSDVSGSLDLGIGDDPLTAAVGVADSHKTELRVEAASIDDLLGRKAIKPPTFVKIDVEGHDPAVLRGMRTSSKRWRPTVIVELHGNSTEVISELTRQDYVIESFSDGGMAHILGLPRA
jgi:FkbM family methyltransferase